jgi:hypothetical protein
VHIHRLHFPVDSQDVGFFSRKSCITSTYNGPLITQIVVEQVTRTEVSPRSTDVDCYYTGVWDTRTVVDPVTKTIASPANYTSSA